MDLDPAAVEAAAKTLYDRDFDRGRIYQGFEWSEQPEGYQREWRDRAAEILVAAAPLIARATADAIADEIRQYRLNASLESLQDKAFTEAEALVRRHGRTAETETTEDGQR